MSLVKVKVRVSYRFWLVGLSMGCWSEKSPSSLPVLTPLSSIGPVQSPPPPPVPSLEPRVPQQLCVYTLTIPVSIGSSDLHVVITGNMEQKKRI